MLLDMKQGGLGLRLHLTTKRTRKREFLNEINCVVLWVALIVLIAPSVPLSLECAWDSVCQRDYFSQELLKHYLTYVRSY